MSLITEALQLRKNQPRSRSRSGESFPPMRRTSPVGKVFAMFFLLAGLVVLGFWKGTWLLEQVESLAGIRGTLPAPAPMAKEVVKPAEPAAGAAVAAAPGPESVPAEPGGEVTSPAPMSVTPEKTKTASAEVNGVKMDSATAAVAVDSKGVTQNTSEEKTKVALPEPMDVNLTLSMIEDEKARQQLDEENQRKIDGFLRRMDIQGVCHQGENSTALLDTVLVRPGDPVGDLGLTLKMIEPRRLIFADRVGREYTKSY